MATITAAAGGGNWNATATWTGGVIPTAADDVKLAATSGSVTIPSGVSCRSLDCTGYTGTLTHAASSILNIGDATAGLGNIALKLVAGMTYTRGSTTNSTINFRSTSATQQTIATGTKTVSRVEVNGAGSSYLLSDALTVSAALLPMAGTLNTNGVAVTCQSAALGAASTARTVTLGASTVTVSGSWSVNTVTGLTFNANTSTIIVSTAGEFGGGGLTYNTVNMADTGSYTISGANTFATLTRTGTATFTDDLILAANQTVTGTLTINGNSATNRMLVKSNTVGTPRTITAATWSVTNTDFQDITGAGAGSRNLSAITGGSGDCGGNSGFTFTTSATQTWNGTTSANWSTLARWTSRVPLPQDDVIIATAFGASQTLTADMPRLGRSINFTGTTWTTAFTFSTTTNFSIFGSLTLVSGMTISFNAATIYFKGRSAYTLTTNGAVGDCEIYLEAPSGTLTLGSNLTLSNTNAVYIVSGTFDTSVSNYNISAGKLFLTGTVMLRGGTHTFNSSGPAWEVASGAAVVNAGTSTLIFNNTTTTAMSFVGIGKTYNNVQFNRGASTGSITITGNNTFNDLKDIGTAAHSLLFTTGTTQTVTTFSVSGSSASARITLNSTTTGTHALVKSGGGTISCDFLNIQHSVASPASTWFAANSINNQSVATAGSGWIFSSSANTASFLLLMI